MTTTVEPTITTIIPTYRRPNSLQRAIRSVLKQTYPHFQVCVYDNASGDNTASVVAAMAETDSRVKYSCHSENIGAFENFRYGLEHVETPFFSFLSDDDVVLADFFETALGGYERHPDAIFSATDVIHLGMNNNILRTALESWEAGYYEPPMGLSTMLDQGHSEWTGILFRKDVIDSIGSLDPATGRFSDLDFTLRIAARCPFVVSKEPGAVFNALTSQTRGQYPFDLAWPGITKMIRNLTDDESIPATVRDHAARALWEPFENGLFKASLIYLADGCAADAKKVAALLREQRKARAKYIALSTMIHMHRSSRFVRSAFDSMVTHVRHVRERRVQGKQEYYRQYRHLVSPLLDS